jgi:hypothetical protein
MALSIAAVSLLPGSRSDYFNEFIDNFALSY